jgi:Spy/CpxP family protein refolding chaperone
MTPSRLTLVIVAAAFLATPALAVDASAPPDSATGGDHHMMMHGMFTREERMMLFADMFKATAGMSDDLKKDYRQQQRRRLMAMSDSDRAKLKSDLDARWNSLPGDQKAAMTAKMQAFMAARHMDGGER